MNSYALLKDKVIDISCIIFDLYMEKQSFWNLDQYLNRVALNLVSSLQCYWGNLLIILAISQILKEEHEI